jgi:hypothetical protein
MWISVMIDFCTLYSMGGSLLCISARSSIFAFGILIGTPKDQIGHLVGNFAFAIYLLYTFNEAILLQQTINVQTIKIIFICDFEPSPSVVYIALYASVYETQTRKSTTNSSGITVLICVKFIHKRTTRFGTALSPFALHHLSNRPCDPLSSKPCSL